MAPLPEILNVCRVQLNWDGTGAATASNVLHFVGLDSIGDIDDLHDALAEYWDTAGAGHDCFLSTSSDNVLATADYTLLDGISGTQHKTFTGLPSFATAGNTIIAACTDVSWGTESRGRSYRGRTYLPFLSEGAQNGGVISSGIVEDMQTAWQVLADGFLPGTFFKLVVASYLLESSANVTSCIVRGGVTTQRRRQSRLNVY